MTRYYDTACRQCADCFFHQKDAFPNGAPYWACRYYGYILHDDNGVADEDCEHYLNAKTEQVTTHDGRRPLSLRDMTSKRRRK